MKLNFNILLGGAAGQGLNTLEQFLGKYLLREGYFVFNSKDYMSRIKGGHNFHLLRVSDNPTQAPLQKIHLLLALNREALELHGKNLQEESISLADLGEEEKKVIDGFPGAFYSIPFSHLARQAGGRIYEATIAAGALLAVLSLPLEGMEQVFKENMNKEQAEKNINALRSGFQYYREQVGETGPSFFLRPEKKHSSPIPLFINGNEALALGALTAGVKFLSAYPMTPSTGIMNYLAARQEEFGLVVEQSEDEIAAINMALGASFAGARSMTVTSGGGFSLMVEGLGLAGITETPIVIVNAQRPGPATGLPTRTEQADLEFVIHASQGEFPRVVLAPVDPLNCFKAARQAFYLADRYQVPVIILSDQHLADSRFTLDSLPEFQEIPSFLAVPQDLQEMGGQYHRYHIAPDGISPRALPGQFPGQVVLADSDEHDELGHITEEAEVRQKMAEKRLRKMQGLAGEIEEPLYEGPEDPDVLLLGWGSTYGALQEVSRKLRDSGQKIGLLQFTGLWPFPSQKAARFLVKEPVSICVENNMTGQLARLIRGETGFKVNHTILKYDGRPFYLEELQEKIAAIL